MRVLIMCEGPNELEIVRILLKNDLLKYSEDDLLGLTPYHARQISTSGQVRTELNIYPGEVEVLRIGDKQSDELRIPKDYANKIVSVKKYCTKPELEILLILAEGLLDEYNKVKSKMRPKEFAKAHISYNGKRYDNSSGFYREYFGNNPQKLVNALTEYKRVSGSHKKDELYLTDLICG